jgi:hypothetical protein
MVTGFLLGIPEIFCKAERAHWFDNPVGHSNPLKMELLATCFGFS